VPFVPVFPIPIPFPIPFPMESVASSDSGRVSDSGSPAATAVAPSRVPVSTLVRDPPDSILDLSGDRSVSRAMSGTLRARTRTGTEAVAGR